VDKSFDANWIRGDFIFNKHQKYKETLDLLGPLIIDGIKSSLKK
jgi:hypothetical protein